jgi:hypothetical protein
LRTLAELTSDDPRWPDVQRCIRAATRPVEVRRVEKAAGEAALVALQVTDRSALGALVRHTGGLILDDGWLRVFGGDRMLELGVQGALAVGADAVGAFFLLDGGALGAAGMVFHLPADTLEPESLDLSYFAWLQWCLAGDLAAYYGPLRWTGWEAEVSRLTWDQGLSLYPPLWSVEGRDPAMVSRRPVPLIELWDLAWSTRERLNGA